MICLPCKQSLPTVTTKVKYTLLSSFTNFFTIISLDVILSLLSVTVNCLNSNCTRKVTKLCSEP